MLLQFGGSQLVELRVSRSEGRDSFGCRLTTHLLSPLSLASSLANSARDLGGRFACGALYGSDCFTSDYSAIAALTNVLASLVGAGIYTYFFSDTRSEYIYPSSTSHPR